MVARGWMAGQVWSEGARLAVRLGGAAAELALVGFEARGGAGAAGAAGGKSATIYSAGFHAERAGGTGGAGGAGGAGAARVSAVLVEEETRVEVRWGGNGSKDATAADADAGPGEDVGEEVGEECVRAWVARAAEEVGGVDAELLRAARVMAAVLGAGAGAGAEGGAGPMRGMVVHGPPGVGKTALVRALLRHAPCAVVAAAGTDFFAADAGASEARVSAAFAAAARRAPAVVFIDDAEAIAPRPARRIAPVERATGLRLAACIDALGAARPPRLPRRGLQRPALQRCAAPRLAARAPCA